MAMKMTIRILYGMIVVSLTISVGCDEKREFNEKEKQETKIVKIFCDKDIWSSKIGWSLTCFPSWTKIGQPKVAVFRDKMVGNKPYKNKSDAERFEIELKLALKHDRVQFNPELRSFSDLRLPGDPVVKVQTVEFFADDDSTRIVMIPTQKDMTFPKGLRMETVHKTLGDPEKISRKVLDSESGGRRPIVLTLHHYAEGAVIYAESDWASKPGTVDRVILDVPKVAKALFREGR